MRKLGLLLAASTMLIPLGGATASTESIHFSNYCDVLNFTINLPTAAMLEHSSSCTADIMAGFEGKMKGLKGKWLFVGGPRFDSGTNAWGWLFQLPFKTGNESYLYESTNGTTFEEIDSDTYVVGTPGRNTKGLLPPAGKSHQNGKLDPNVPKTLHF
jgi:hypothetical protein